MSFPSDLISSDTRGKENKKPKKYFCPDPAGGPVGLGSFDEDWWLKKHIHSGKHRSEEMADESNFTGVFCTTAGRYIELFSQMKLLNASLALESFRIYEPLSVSCFF